MTLAGFSFLADYLSVRLTSKKIIQVAKDHKYFTSIQTLSETSFNLFYTTQTVKLLPDNNTISYVIYLINTINKDNIDIISIKYKQVIYNLLVAKVYAMAYRLVIEKQHWEKY